MVPRRGRIIGVTERRMAFAQSHPELDPAVLDDAFERSSRIDAALDKYGRFAPSIPLDDSQLTCQPVLAQLGAITRDELSAIQNDELLRSVRLVLMLLGYRTVSELLADDHNVFIDPYSALLSVHARIGTGNVFSPNVRIDAESDALRIGDGNRFFEGTRIEATDGGRVSIGADNEFGPHAVALLANRHDAVITVGSRVRLIGRIDLAGASTLGDGSQILGDVTAVNVSLVGGGSHRDPDPDLRGAVLKGRGRATGLTLARGHVINADGSFATAAVEAQSVYHPRPAVD